MNNSARPTASSEEASSAISKSSASGKSVPVPELSVVIPVHNEEANISELIDEIELALAKGPNFEVVVVDDASDDSTGAVLAKAKVDRDWLKFHRHRKRQGQSAAILTGIRFAEADWIATLDGDGQNDPADIPKLIKARDQSSHLGHLQMVIGSRTRRRDSLVKRLSSRIANRVRRAALGDSTIDTGCGLKLISRQTFLELPHFNHFHRFLPALVQRNGGKVIAVGVSHRPRTKGKSHYGTLDRLGVGLVDLLGVMWLQKRRFGRIEVIDPGEYKEE